MRSIFLLAALAANAVCAFEKSLYVTDWTTVTVTKAVTVPTTTETVPVAHQVQFNYETTTLSAATVDAEHSDLAKAPAVESIGSFTSALEAALTTRVAEKVQASDWSTARTSTIELEPTISATSALSVTSISAGATATSANAYQQAVLYNHNIHRRNHSAPSLHWSADLETSARALAAKCVYEHDTYVLPAILQYQTQFNILAAPLMAVVTARTSATVLTQVRSVSCSAT
jgi:hypothetical protein